MLNFYFWDGIRNDDDIPNNLEYIDSIYEKEFIRLRFFWNECEKLGIYLNPFEDMYFDRNHVEILYFLCKKMHVLANKNFYEKHIGKRPIMTLYVHLLEILSKLYESKKCLVLLCD